MWKQLSTKGREYERIVIASFVARWTAGEPRLSDEVEWTDPAGPLPPTTTPELGEVLARAARIAAEQA